MALTKPALQKRIRFDEAYLKAMIANPELAEHHAAADAARNELKTLAQNEASPAVVATALAAFERERIAPLLIDLDKRVDDYIRREALAVGAATAVSLNGSIDAFVVLWRNANMVSRIARLYYGRPSLRLSLLILRDVTLAVILSRVLDDVTDAAGDALSGLVTKLGGMVVGPVMDGSINALVTLKLGYLAKKRCRSFEVWSQSNTQRAALEVFEQVRRESTGLIGDLLKLCGGAVGGVAGVAAGAAGAVLSAPKSAWSLVQNALVRKPPGEKESAT